MSNCEGKKWAFQQWPRCRRGLSPPVVGCLLEKGLQKGGLEITGVRNHRIGIYTFKKKIIDTADSRQSHAFTSASWTAYVDVKNT